jgi:hypothetical protein
MTTYNTPAQVFDAAEEMSVALAEQLMMMGIGSKEEAKPHALQWASKKYGVPIRTGQRGDGFARTQHDLPTERHSERQEGCEADRRGCASYQQVSGTDRCAEEAFSRRYLISGTRCP